MSTKKIPARIHAILARERSRGVVFRRGPSNKVAVIGWDLNKDEFTLGQWLKGRIYEYRCDLSPKGDYLLYFAAKYGKTNSVEARVNELVQAEIGEFDWGNYNERYYQDYRKRELEAEQKIREEHAVELEKIRRGRDYTDRSWTAIARIPYLKAIDLWFNGSGWNGGGWFTDDTHVWINQPHPIRGKHEHHMVSGKFRELPEPPEPQLITENGGECPGIYLPRLERDGWNFVKYTETYAEYSKALPDDLTLLKRFYYAFDRDKKSGVGVYYEDHDLCRGDELLMDGTDWRWADYDAKRRRIVFACNGAIFALSLKRLNDPAQLLFDFDGMEYETLQAPYCRNR